MATRGNNMNFFNLQDKAEVIDKDNMFFGYKGNVVGVLENSVYLMLDTKIQLIIGYKKLKRLEKNNELGRSQKTSSKRTRRWRVSKSGRTV